MAGVKTILAKLTLPSAILVCCAVISRYFSEPFTFPVNIDDCLYSALLQKHSIWELMQMLSGKYNGAYVPHFDGRLFSNFYSLIVFSILKTHHSLYYLYDLFMFFVLALSFFFLFSVLQKNKIISGIARPQNALLSVFTASVLFIFLLDGRYEVFYWVSGISNHLLSIIFFVFSLALFIDKNSFLRSCILPLLAFCFGQMNEVYAVNYMFVFFLLTFFVPGKKIYFAFLLCMTVFSIYLNLSAHGTAVRFNTLYNIETHFNFTGALKDTFDTFLLPFLNYRYLPVKIPATILLFLLLRNKLHLQLSIKNKHFLLFNRLMLIGAVLSVFMHCYILGEICTYRGLLFYFLVIIYFVFVMAAKSMYNPLRLFFNLGA